MDVFLPPLWRSVACVFLGLSCSAAAHAGTESVELQAEPYRWRIEFSPHTSHFSYNPAHRHVRLFGLEREAPDNRVYGLALFSNSFGQESGYLYLGKSYYGVLDGAPQLYLKWSVGVLYGYKPPYENKVPLNYKGFSPAVVPAIGWRFDSGWRAQINVLGTAALTYSLVKEF